MALTGALLSAHSSRLKSKPWQGCASGVSLRVSIRASVVASKVFYVQHVKENRPTLRPTLTKSTYEIGGRLHSAMRTIGTTLAHECLNTGCIKFADYKSNVFFLNACVVLYTISPDDYIYPCETPELLFRLRHP